MLMELTCCGTAIVAITVSWKNPTSKSAIAKLISKSKVRFSQLRCFQNVYIW